MTPLSLTNAAGDAFAAQKTTATSPQAMPERSAADPIGRKSRAAHSDGDQFVRTTAAPADGPNPVETQPGQAYDESVWRFVVESPATETPAAETSVPESWDASGAKSAPKAVARPALPDARPAEKVVNDAAKEAPVASPVTGGGDSDTGVRVEQWNVDIARQFAQMMLARRAYQTDSEGTVVSGEWLVDSASIRR